MKNINEIMFRIINISNCITNALVILRAYDIKNNSDQI